MQSRYNTYSAYKNANISDYIGPFAFGFIDSTGHGGWKLIWPAPIFHFSFVPATSCYHAGERFRHGVQPDNRPPRPPDAHPSWRRGQSRRAASSRVYLV